MGGSCKFQSRAATLNREELLHTANEYARETGGNGVTERQLRDWVDEKLVPGPKARGRKRGLSPERVWTEKSLTILKQIVWLKNRGVWRNRALMLHVWVYGTEYPHNRLREALACEHGRLLHRQRRKTSVSKEPRELWRLSNKHKELERKKLGPLDPQFAALGLAPPTDTMLPMASLMESGLIRNSESERLRRGVGAFIMATVGEGAMDSDYEALLDSELSGFEGMFGLHDETDQAVETRINQFEECDLDFAKQRLLLMISSFRIMHEMSGSNLFGERRFFLAQYERIAASLLAGDYLVSWLVQGANSSYLARMRTEG